MERIEVSNEAEGALIAAAARGDTRAFEIVFHLYRPRLARFLRHLTRRASIADEVLNDTMLAVWHKAGTFNGRCKVSTWIFAIAYRKALKARRRSGGAARADPAAEPTSAAPEGELLRLELNARIHSAMRTLSAEQRTVVELTYFHGLDYPEIATIVRCPLGTVKTRMFHARRRLGRLLEGERERSG